MIQTSCATARRQRTRAGGAEASLSRQHARSGSSAKGGLLLIDGDLALHARGAREMKILPALLMGFFLYCSSRSGQNVDTPGAKQRHPRCETTTPPGAR